MPTTRPDREKNLREIGSADVLQLIRIYQGAIGTPHGQIPIPGPSLSRMIDVILKKEFPNTPQAGAIG